MSPYAATYRLVPAKIYDPASAGIPMAEIIASATCSPVISEIEVSVSLSTLANIQPFGLGTPAAAGIGAKTVGKMLLEDANTDTAQPVTIANDWDTPPTAPTAFFRRVTMASSANATRHKMIFPSGLKMARGSSLVLWLPTDSPVGGTIAIPLFDLLLRFDG